MFHRATFGALWRLRMLHVWWHLLQGILHALGLALIWTLAVVCFLVHIHFNDLRQCLEEALMHGA